MVYRQLIPLYRPPRPRGDSHGYYLLCCEWVEIEEARRNGELSHEMAERLLQDVNDRMKPWWNYVRTDDLYERRDMMRPRYYNSVYERIVWLDQQGMEG